MTTEIAEILIGKTNSIMKTAVTTGAMAEMKVPGLTSRMNVRVK